MYAGTFYSFWLFHYHAELAATWLAVCLSFLVILSFSFSCESKWTNTHCEIPIKNTPLHLTCLLWLKIKIQRLYRISYSPTSCNFLPLQYLYVIVCARNKPSQELPSMFLLSKFRLLWFSLIICFSNFLTQCIEFFMFKICFKIMQSVRYLQKCSFLLLPRNKFFLTGDWNAILWASGKQHLKNRLS